MFESHWPDRHPFITRLSWCRPSLQVSSPPERESFQKRGAPAKSVQKSTCVMGGFQASYPLIFQLHPLSSHSRMALFPTAPLSSSYFLYSRHIPRATLHFQTLFSYSQQAPPPHSRTFNHQQQPIPWITLHF